MHKPWLASYSGQTTDELLSLASEYRIDSLVCAFEQAMDQKAARVGEHNLTEEERIILGIEALEREVNNGGYEQFFINSSKEFAPMIVGWLLRIGCPTTAEITQNAIDALKLDNPNEKLRKCDGMYFQSGESIENQLFAFYQSK